HPSLIGGWSQRDTLPTGESVVWGMARRTSIRFAIREPADARLIVRCGMPGAADVRRFVPVMVSLKRRRVGTLRLGLKLQEHELRLPIRTQRAGMNELEFANPLVFRGGPRYRRLDRAMACDAIRLEGGDEPGAPAGV